MEAMGYQLTVEARMQMKSRKSIGLGDATGVIALALSALVVLFYVVTIAKLGANAVQSHL